MLRGTGQSREEFSQQVNSALHAFCDEFQEQQDFVSYFQKHWARTRQVIFVHLLAY